MNDFTAKFYQIALMCTPQVGNIVAKRLVDHFGSAAAVFEADRKALAAVEGVRTDHVKGLIGRVGFGQAEKECRFLEQATRRAVFYTDADYPKRLLHFADCPPLLYVRGDMDLNPKRAVAIVGTRKATSRGLAQCERLIEELAGYAPTIVSGLAYGIDICAHRKAVALNLPTIAAVAHGIDRVYPGGHTKTAKAMCKSGGIISEYPSETLPDARHFPMRNRIIAAFCDALIVVETADKGGSMITAELAIQYKKEVFAFPGRVQDKLSKGCNRLIKNHQASLLEHGEELAQALRWNRATTGQQRALFVTLDKDETHVASFIQAQEQVHLDTLLREAGVTRAALLDILLRLEFKGVVKTAPGKYYVWVDY